MNLESDVAGIFPLSLQDYCKLNILLYIDQYPVELLSKLPTSIRRKLFLALPVCDRLHLWDTEFLSGLELDCSPFKTIDLERQKLVSSTLYAGPTHFRSFFIFNFHEALESFDFFYGSKRDENSVGDFIEHIFSLYIGSTHLHDMMQIYSFKAIFGEANRYTNVRLNSCRFLLIPPRYFKFNELEVITESDMLGLIDYCQLVKVLQYLEIDVKRLHDSYLWQKLQNNLRIEIDRKLSPSCSVPVKLTMVCPPPFLSSIFSFVKHLQITSFSGVYCSGKGCAFFSVPYIILHIIASSKSANLKSIRVNGDSVSALLVLQAIAGFLCGRNYTSRNFQCFDGKHCNVCAFDYLLCPPDDPLLIESLSLRVNIKRQPWTFGFVTEYVSTTVSNVVKHNLEIRMKNLHNVNFFAIESLSIFGKGVAFLCFPGYVMDPDTLVTGDYHAFLKDYCEPVINDHANENCKASFIDARVEVSLSNPCCVEFVKRPKFLSLVLSDSSDQFCYGIIATFLATPAPNEQQGLMQSILVTPPTNGKFKLLTSCLDRMLGRQFIVISLPNIELLKLQVPFAKLSDHESWPKRAIVPHHLCLSIIALENIPMFVSKNPLGEITILEFNTNDASSFFTSINL